MFPPDPGALDLIDPTTIRRLAPRPSLVGIVADALGQSGELDGLLARRALDVVDNPPEDLDATYAATVGTAAESVAQDVQTMPGSQVPASVNAGDNADQLRQGVLAYLPQPDAPITARFEEPPPVPHVPPGSGLGGGPHGGGGEGGTTTA